MRVEFHKRNRKKKETGENNLRRKDALKDEIEKLKKELDI